MMRSTIIRNRSETLSGRASTFQQAPGMRQALTALRASAKARVGFHRAPFRAGSGADVVLTQGIAHAKDHRNRTIPKTNNAND